MPGVSRNESGRCLRARDGHSVAGLVGRHARCQPLTMYETHTNAHFDEPEPLGLEQMLEEAGLSPTDVQQAAIVCEAYSQRERAHAVSVIVPRLLDWVLDGNAKANPLARPLALAWALGHGASTQHRSMAESAEAVGMSRAGMQQLCARAKAHLGL